jgi:hypothetical protein
MSHSSTTAANSGRSAEAPPARGFNPMPPPRSRTLDRAEPNPRNFSNRGRNASRSRTPNPYVPKRPTEPHPPPQNFVVGVPQPHSEAELAAHALVLEEFNKELVAYNEAIAAIEQGRPKPHVRGLKRSHHGQNGLNGNNSNILNINPDSTSNPAQHREHVRSSPSSQLPSPTLANPNGQASQNSVLQTLPHQATQLAHQAPQMRELNNEYLLAYNEYLYHQKNTIKSQIYEILR